MYKGLFKLFNFSRDAHIATVARAGFELCIPGASPSPDLYDMLNDPSHFISEVAPTGKTVHNVFDDLAMLGFKGHPWQNPSSWVEVLASSQQWSELSDVLFEHGTTVATDAILKGLRNELYGPNPHVSQILEKLKQSRDPTSASKIQRFMELQIEFSRLFNSTEKLVSESLPILEAFCEKNVEEGAQRLEQAFQTIDLDQASL